MMASVSPAHAGKNPYEKPDDSWITISGTAVQPTDDSFKLDYGPAMITVEVDDWDDFDEAKLLLDGDKVTVHGKIDDDMYEMSKIEAASIYVDDLHTYLYANPTDEEDIVWTANTPINPANVTVSGTVTDTDIAQNRLTVDTGKSRLDVDLEDVGYNPVDNYGYQQIDEGDVVSVTGTLDADLFSLHDLDAHQVQTIHDLK